MSVGKLTLNSAMATVLSFCVAFSVMIMLCMHLSLVGNNASTLEYVDLAMNNEGNPYDAGCLNNFKQIMGPDWFFCPFRVEPTFKG